MNACANRDPNDTDPQRWLAQFSERAMSCAATSSSHRTPVRNGGQSEQRQDAPISVRRRRTARP